MRYPIRVLLWILVIPARGWAGSLSCDMSAYRDQPGLRAQQIAHAVQLTWTRERRQELRVLLGIEKGVPIVREIAARKTGGAWEVLGRSLVPEFEITSGMRR